MSINAFFYGTLMHPKVLKRVIKNNGSHLEICPAVLLDHTRHEVKHAEYPGVIPYEKTLLLCGKELETEDRSVRGTLVTGLTDADMRLLDHFEGDEYIRREVDVHPLEDLIPLNQYDKNDDSALIPANPPPLPKADQLASPIKAGTYIYLDYRDLRPDLWSFEEFVQLNAAKWYGPQGEEDVRWTTEAAV